MLRDALYPALATLAGALELGTVPRESHGLAPLVVLGGWLVVRDGRLEPSCVAEVYARINARIEALHRERAYGAIASIYYALARLHPGTR